MILFSLGWMLTCLARPAWAQASAEPAANDACVADPRCKELADRGQAEYQAQQFEAALVSLRDAYALQPVSWLVFNIGRIHQKAGRKNEALAAYQTFLQRSQAADEAAQREKARAYVDQVEHDRAASVVAQASAGPLPSSDRKPIYKKWWFWTIIGTVAAAGIAGGIAGGVVASQNQNQIPMPSFSPFKLSF